MKGGIEALPSNKHFIDCRSAIECHLSASSVPCQSNHASNNAFAGIHGHQTNHSRHQETQRKHNRIAGTSCFYNKSGKTFSL